MLSDKISDPRIENEFLLGIVNSLNAAIYINLHDGAITWANDYFRVLTGFTREEINHMGLVNYQRAYYHEDDLNIFEESMKAIQAMKEDDYLGVFRFRHKDGRWKKVLGSGRTLERFKDGSFKKGISILIDISGDFHTKAQINSILKERLREKNNTLLTALSPRELQVFHKISDGRSTKDIADELSISFHTVESHRKNIFNKLRIRSTAELIRIAHLGA